MSFVLRNLRAHYGASSVLRGIDLRVERGEIVAVSGRNGAGKSTLLRAIAGLTPARADEFTLAGKPFDNLAPEERFARGITFVPQGHRVFPSLSVGENVTLGVRVRGERAWSLAEIRERIPLVSQRFDQRAGTLSGGETQLVLVARALVGNGRLILMDEPAEGLDTNALALLQSLIIDSAERGASVLLAEQRTSYLDAIGARRFSLEGGQLGISFGSG